MDLPASARVRAALAAVPRADFLPADMRAFAHANRPLPIGHGQTSSQPWTVAFMLELLDVRPGQRVLDVGAGSGWTTALLSHLVGQAGEVIGVERIPAVREFGNANLARAGYGHISIEQAGQEVGWPPRAPYDRILVSAMARQLPGELVAQLSDEQAIAVIPVAGVMQRVRRSAGATHTSSHGEFAFVPLVT